MTDEIEPALTAQEWKEVAIPPAGEVFADTIVEIVHQCETRQWPQAIALANALLPDSDPRKITWAMVETLRSAADSPRSAYASADELTAIANSLASYLPPRTP